jgi:predicted NAD/FAD-binding protein
MQAMETMRPAQRLAERWLGVCLAMAIFLPLAGCAGAGLAVVGAGTGVAMGTGVDYTLNGIAYKTYTAPMDDVRVATRAALENMAIAITKDEAAEKGWQYEGLANERVIRVELQELTPRTTRIRVVAEDGVFFKDRATAAEIIYQTADALDHPRTKAARAAKPKAKPKPAKLAGDASR